jgi:hypothetical protein
VIYERAQFNRRNQLDGETAENYIVTLYELSENCDYGDMTDEMTRDCLVVGIRDTVLSEKLQMDPKLTLTLDAVKKVICQREEVHEQQQMLNGSSKAANADFDAIPPQRKKKQRAAGAQRGRENSPVPRQQKTTQRQSGGKCGNCHNCGHQGHYSAQCRKREISSIQDQDDDTPSSTYLDTVSTSRKNAWIAHTINGARMLSTTSGWRQSSDESRKQEEP